MFCTVLCSIHYRVVFLLQAGTEDGCVVLFSMTSDGIVYDRQLDKQECKYSDEFQLNGCM
jgi:hypothetical protein